MGARKSSLPVLVAMLCCVLACSTNRALAQEVLIRQAVWAEEPDYPSLVSSGYPAVLSAFSTFVTSAYNSTNNPTFTTQMGLELAKDFNCNRRSLDPAASTISLPDALSAIDAVTGSISDPNADYDTIDGCDDETTVDPDDPSTTDPKPTSECAPNCGGPLCINFPGTPFGFCIEAGWHNPPSDPTGLEDLWGGGAGGGGDGGDELPPPPPISPDPEDPPVGGGGGGGGASNGNPETLSGSPTLKSRDFSELYTRGGKARTVSSTFASQGWRWEDDEDLRVALPGTPFVLSRKYEAGQMFANHSEQIPWLIGRGWQTSAQSWLMRPELLAGFSYTNVGKLEIKNAPVGGSTILWREYQLDTPATLEAHRPLGTGHGTARPSQETYFDYATGQQKTIVVWIHRSPGKGVQAYYDHGRSVANAPDTLVSDLDGYLLYTEDLFGNRSNYRYRYLTLSDLSGTTPRLDKIYLHGVNEFDSAAWVRFEWDDGSSGVQGSGRLRSAAVFRRTDSGANTAPVKTQEVIYTYYRDLPGSATYLVNAERPDGQSFPLSFVDNVVQVERRIRINLPAENQASATAGTPEYISSFQQYRYSVYQVAGNSAFPTRKEILTHEISPAQIEWFAEHWDDAGAGPASTKLERAAQKLLETPLQADGGSTLPLFGGQPAVYVDDLVSQTTEYYDDRPQSGRVKTQWFADGPGRGLSRRLDYTYNRAFVPGWTPYGGDFAPLNDHLRPRRYATRIREWKIDPAGTNAASLIDADPDRAWFHHKTTLHWSEDIILREFLTPALAPGTPPGFFRSRAQYTVATAIVEPGWELKKADPGAMVGDPRAWVTYHHFRHDDQQYSVVFDPNSGYDYFVPNDHPTGVMRQNGRHLRIFHPSAIADLHVDFPPDGWVFASGNLPNDDGVGGGTADDGLDDDTGLPIVPPMLQYHPASQFDHPADRAVEFRPGGRTEEFAYDNLGRLEQSKERRISDAYVWSATNVPTFDDETIVEERAYVANTTGMVTPDELLQSDRIDLLAAIERRRVHGVAPSPAADDVERVEYTYVFETIAGTRYDRVARSTIRTERELSSENGPGTVQWAVTERGWNDAGLETWTLRPDLTLKAREYSSKTGAPRVVRRNAPVSAVPTADLPLDTTGWAPNAATDGTLVSTVVSDLSGRTLATTDQRGVSMFYTAAKLQYQPDSASASSGLTYLTQITVPHKWVDGPGLSYAGPATVEWVSRTGRLLKQSRFVADLPSSAFESVGDYDGDAQNEEIVDWLDLQSQLASESWFDGQGWFADETARAVQRHDIHDFLVESRVWHDVAGTVDVDSAAATQYKTEYTYDVLGRQVDVKLPNGSVERHAQYDIMDRVLEIQQGMLGDPEPYPVAVRHYFDGGALAQQGTGEGNLTWVSVNTGELDAGQPVYRHVRNVYDWRNWQTAASAPTTGTPFVTPAVAGGDTGPHSVAFYDNRGRQVEAAVVASLPAAAITDLTRGTVADVGSLSGLASADIGAISRSFFSQRGLTYRVETAVDPTDGLSDDLVSNAWYDDVGRTTAVVAPGGAVTKTAYDALGRVSRQVVSDGDAARGSGTYADIVGLDGPDWQFAETNYTYRAASASVAPGVLAMVRTTQRWHDSVTSDLDANAIDTFAGTVYDPAARVIGTIDYGTNLSANVFASGGTQPVIPETVPDRGLNPDLRITETRYDDRGRAFEVVDAEGVTARSFLDDLGRVIATAANVSGPAAVSIAWDGVAGRWGVTTDAGAAADENRVTSMVYDEIDNVTKRVAHYRDLDTASDAVQVTEYVYDRGAALNGNLAVLDGFLYAIRYPNDTTGEPSIAAADTVHFAYNYLGEQLALEDRNGTRRAFDRDTQGRVVADRVASFGGPTIDTAVRRLETAYDGLGRTAAARSFDAAVGGNAVNAVEYTYHPWGDLSILTQKVTPFGTGATERSYDVRFGYDRRGAATGNVHRLEWMAYPDDSALFPVYGTFDENLGTIDDDTPGSRIDRVRQLRLSGRATTQGERDDPTLLRGTSDLLAAYDHLGVATVAITDLGLTDFQLDRTIAADGSRWFGAIQTGTAGAYPGWDRYGRLQRLVAGEGNMTLATGRLQIGEAYTYDRVSNRLTKDTLDGWHDDQDWSYSYDGLHRLTSLERGTLSGAPATVSPPADGQHSRTWVLDKLGNWGEQTTVSYVGGVAQTPATEARNHNRKNELTDVGGQGRTYDANGNLVEVQHASGAVRTHRYDAWNRLVEIELDPSDMSGVRTIAAYAYNALHWQVKRTADTDSDGDFDESRVMVYSPAWQLLHEEIQFDDEVGGETQPTPTVDLVAQQVWGARGLDDALYRRVDDDPGVDAVYERGFFYVTDASFSVLALLNDTTGYVHERVGYGSYGTPEAWFPEDIDRDGDLTFFDVSAYNAWFNASDPRADFARPWGTINFFDQSQFQGGFNSKERGPGGIADEGSSGTWNRIGYAGSVWDPVAGLWLSRHRHYEPEAGRWLTPDPAGYVDGLSLYLYARGNPITLVDPMGLMGEDGDDNLVMRVLRSVFGGDDDRERSASAAEGRPAPGNPGRGALDEQAVRDQMQETVDQTRDLIEMGYGALPGGAAVVTAMHLVEGDYAGAAEYAATEGAINLVASATLGFAGGLAKPVVKQVGKGLENAGALRRLAGTTGDRAAGGFRYIGEGEAGYIRETGFVPNTTLRGRPKDVFYTLDAPLNSAQEARYVYQLPQLPTHRVRVDTSHASPDYAGNVEGGTGIELTTRRRLPALEEPRELDP